MQSLVSQTFSTHTYSRKHGEIWTDITLIPIATDSALTDIGIQGLSASLDDMTSIPSSFYEGENFFNTKRTSKAMLFILKNL